MVMMVVVVTVVVARVWVWEVRGHDWDTAREESVAEAERSRGWGLEAGVSLSTQDTFISGRRSRYCNLAGSKDRGTLSPCVEARGRTQGAGRKVLGRVPFPGLPSVPCCLPDAPPAFTRVFLPMFW